MKRFISFLCSLLFLSIFAIEVSGQDLNKTVWRCTSKECLKWAPEGTQYVEMHFYTNSPAPHLNYVYSNPDPIKNKFEVWFVSNSYKGYLEVGKGEGNPYIPIEIKGNQISLKNSRVWKEKPDFVFTRIK